MANRNVVMAAFAGSVASLVVYMGAAVWRPTRAWTNPDQYFLAKRGFSDSEFAGAQIAYGLQMGTVYPFFLMVATGDWYFPVANTIGYAVGIFLFLVLIPLFSRSALNLVGSSRTIHAVVGNLHQSTSLRVTASLLTVLGFAGLAAFEIVFGARVF